MEATAADPPPHLPISSPLPMIVIVEDEVLVRAGTARYLREAGFMILEATTAEECMALLATEKSIKVVFTDVRLPGQSGLDLIRVIRRIHPHVKVVVTTGYQLDEPLPAGVSLLRKPYFLFEIERRIGVLLGQTELARQPRRAAPGQLD